ncbi:TPA: nuclease domain-containing protein, partial [Escherichia coli]
LCGTGIKPPDLIATIACSACHDEIDRRTHFVDAAYAKECALEGMARTQVIWLDDAQVVDYRVVKMPVTKGGRLELTITEMGNE